MVLLAGAWPYTFIAKPREARVTLPAARLLASEWIACGISMTAVFVAAVFLKTVPSEALAGLTGAFLASAMMATGRLTHIRWLTTVGALWWVGAVVRG